MEIVALVGASGTGKSQRAVVFASELGTPYIIDDGLFIKDGQILAGRSAKAEATKVGAVKRAIFLHSDHQAEVKRVIEREAPQRLLVLATSNAMVLRITEALDLPRPTSWLTIQDVVTKSEIEAALMRRKRYGQHVIPVPTLEVRKTFTGYVINPLRLLYRGGRVRSPMMIEKSLVRPPFSSLGKVFISDRVIMQIADRALGEVQGIRPAAPPVIRVRDGQVFMSVTCTVDPDISLVRSLEEAQKRVKEMVEEMAYVEVASVNLYVTGTEHPR